MHSACRASARVGRPVPLAHGTRAATVGMSGPSASGSVCHTGRDGSALKSELQPVADEGSGGSVKTSALARASSSCPKATSQVVYQQNRLPFSVIRCKDLAMCAKFFAEKAQTLVQSQGLVSGSVVMLPVLMDAFLQFSSTLRNVEACTIRSSSPVAVTHSASTSRYQSLYQLVPEPVPVTWSVPEPVPVIWFIPESVSVTWFGPV
ncbi:UNVERIFIED_CONTAM: hypothetical protein FKN15_060893 [Acipenser sinensis]